MAYLHADHLGSVNVASGAGAALLSRQAFGPWGNVASGGVSQTALNFTGQRLDSGSGLLYYHARYYDPLLARFVSADTIIPGQADKAGTPNPQHLNRYSYVLNNPVTKTDPSGHCGTIGFLATAQSVLSGDCTRRAIEGIGRAQNVGDKALLGFVAGASAVGAAAGWVGGTLLAGEALAGVASVAEAVTAPVAQAVSARIVAAGAAGVAGTAASEIASTCSFSADTLVATSDGVVAIASLKVGNQVLSYDQATGTTGTNAITAVLVHTDHLIEQLMIGGEQLQTTPEHPFYTIEHGWTSAQQLHIGDHVLRADGTTSSVEAYALAWRPQVMYNLTVATAHTFFVGRQRWLVHNSCGDLLDPNTIRFTQDSIKSTFKDGGTINNMISKLVSGQISADDVPPIRIFERGGNLATLDNRRLYAFQQAGQLIRTIQATAQEITDEAWKFTTRNGGTSIRVRGQ